MTEFAERGDLTGRLEERKGVPLREEQVLDYFVQMCLSLLYLHKKKILHRDLKLANVFLSADNQVKLGGGWRAAGECCSDRPQKTGNARMGAGPCQRWRTTLRSLQVRGCHSMSAPATHVATPDLIDPSCIPCLPRSSPLQTSALLAY